MFLNSNFIACLRLFASVLVAMLLLCPVLFAQYSFTRGVLFYHNAAEKKLISSGHMSTPWNCINCIANGNLFSCTGQCCRDLFCINV